MPYPAVRLFVTALEYASHGDADRACITLADSDVPPAWFAILAVDTLAGACWGPDASAWWAKLRQECHQLAVDTDAADEELRASLAVIALAESRERGQGLRVMELADLYVNEFGDDVLGCVGVQLTGMVLAHRYGDQLDGLFVRMKRHFAIEDGAP